MRALLRDKEDGTLLAVSVVSVCYSPEAMELYIDTGHSGYTIERIIQVNADSLIRELFENGKADMTNYQATIDEE